MSVLLKWGLLVAVVTAFVGTAMPANAQCNPQGQFDLAFGKCTGGKIKCAIGKKSCLLGCYKKAAKGAPVDPACLTKCRTKFDGGTDPAKGCFAKLEAKGGCATTNDTAAIEHKIDGFVLSAIAALHNTSPVGTASKCLAGKINCLIGYDKCKLGVYAGAAKKGFRIKYPTDALNVQPKLDKCTAKIKACYAKLEAKIPPDCLTFGDVLPVLNADNTFIDDLTSELVSAPLGRDMDTRRCQCDTSVRCTTNFDCPGSCPCAFYFGSNLPLSAGGVATCVTNQWNGGIAGTANQQTGQSAGTASVLARVYTGLTTDQPCPRCVNDFTVNDRTGCPLGTCDGGPRVGQPCDANGVSPNPSFGSTSMDCPPNPGSLIGTLPIDLTNANNANVSITLAASSPSCNGAPGKKCACASCSGNSQIPCRNDFDCIAAGAGTCTNIAGEPRKPNGCIDDSNFPGDGTICSDVAPVGDGEGACVEGPVVQHCKIATQRGCLTDFDCTSGGDPSDVCVANNRPCIAGYNGVVGDKIQAEGSFTTPIDHWSHPTFASVFCIPPTASTSVNSVAGLPGPGRLELSGEATDNGDALSCPTQFDFLPTAKGGVLDTGWTGIAHDANVIGQGKVTVAVTGCIPGTPGNCGECTYTGPVPNPNVAP
jgi:hypothetical protein